MASLFSLDDVKNKPHRSSFDLQAKRAFTAKAGELLPVYWSFTMPGDKFKLKNTWFTRTQPVQTSAYTRMREYYDYFFVPLRQLWKQAPQSIMQMTDNSTAATSSTQGAQVGTLFPQVTLAELYAALTATTSSPTFANSNNPLGYRRGDLAVKLLRYLGYGNVFTSGYETNYGTTNTTEDYNQSYGQNVSVNILPLLAYQKIYNDFFRETQWEKSTPYTFNVDYWTGTGSFGTQLKNQTQNYSTLGRTMLDMGYVNWNKDMFMGVKPTSQYGDVAIVNVGSDASQQLISLTGGNFNLTGSGSITGNNTGSGFFGVKATGSGGSSTQVYVADKTVIQDPYGIQSSEGVSGTLSGTLYVGNGTGNFSSLSLESSDPVWTGAKVEQSAISSEFSVLALRQAEALQKWKEITLSGDQSYRDQIYKHFGVTLPAEMSDLVRYLGGNVGNLDISEVMNTNLATADNVDTQALIKGKGTGAGNGKEIEFEAKEHGIIMCIYHATPILDYDLSGQDPQLLLTSSEDFPIPEFDNLGMQEVPLVSMVNSSDVETTTFPYLGYGPRYYQFKTSIDRVFGAFSTTLRDWVAPVNDAFVAPFINRSPGLSFPLTYNFFKVNPAILDNIFAMKVDGTWDTDQFLVNSQFDVSVARNLSMTGLPY